MEKTLPKNWVETTVGHVANNVQYGYTASSEDSKKGIRFLRITDIQNNKVDWESVPTCEIEPDKVPKFQLLPNDLVFARTGATVGKSFLIKEPPYTAVFASYLIRVTVYENIQIQFVKYFFDSRSYWEQISESSSGIGQPSVNATKLKELFFPLPPLAEQQRIVAKLDGLFGHLENVKTRLSNVPQLLKNFRQAILTQAVTGKLTEEWREGKDWEMILLKDYTSKIGSGSTPRGGSKNYKTEGIPLVRSMNIHFNGIKSKGLAFIDDDQAEALKNVIIEENDVLLNITGASIGRVCLADKTVKGGRVNQHVCIIRPKEGLKPNFLNFYLSSSIIQNFINDENYGVTRQALTKTQIQNLEIPIPSIEEQTEIINKVESLFIKADAIEAKYYTLKAQIDSLPQAILAKGFKGELVEQLPTDGNAKDLLEEIQKLKTAAETEKKTTKLKLPKTKVEKITIKGNTTVKPSLTATIKVIEPKGIEANFLWQHLRSSVGLEQFEIDQVDLPPRYTYDKFKNELFQLLDQCHGLNNGPRLVQNHSNGKFLYQIKLK